MTIEGEEVTHRYRAFISYAREDREIAVMLQRALERFVLPRAIELAEPMRQRGPKPLAPVFRDEDELLPGGDLPGRIRQGLSESEFLIVVCSPAAAASKWVAKEILDFISLGREKQILAVIVDGEPDAANQDKESLPLPLRRVVKDGHITEVSAETLWIDWRGQSRNDRLNFLRLVGALLSLSSLDELIRRDQQAERRRRLVAQGVAATMIALALITAFAAWVAFNQRQEALASRDRILVERSRILAERADRANLDGRHTLAGSIALAALAPLTSDAALLKQSSEAQAVLTRALMHDRERHVLRGHTDRVWAVAIAGHGGKVVTGSWDGSVRLWNARNGALIKGLAKERNKITCVAIDSAGSRIVSGSLDGDLRFFDGDGRELAHEMIGPTGLVTVAIDASGTRAVSVGGTGAVALWDARTGRLMARLDSRSAGQRALFEPGQYAAISADGSRVAIASGTGLDIWDGTSGTYLRAIERTNVLALSGDGSLVVAGSDTAIKLWNTNTGALLHSFDGDGRILAVGISRDGARIMGATRGGKVRVWDVASGKQVSGFDGAFSTAAIASPKPTAWSAFAYAVAMSADGERIVTGAGDMNALLFDAGTGRRLQVLAGHEAPIPAVALSDDASVIVTGSWDASARLWNGGEPLSNVAILARERPQLVQISADGSRVLAAFQQTARVWDRASGAVLLSFDSGPSGFASAKMSSNGALAVIGLHDGKLIFYDVKSGRQIRLTDTGGSSAETRQVEISADGTRVLTTCNQRRACLWNGRTGDLVKELSAEGVSAMALSGHGQRAVTNSSANAFLWNANDGALIKALSRQRLPVTSIAVSASGNIVVTGTNGGDTIVWDGRNGDELRTLPGAAGPVTMVAVGSNGGTIVTRDRTLHLWASESGETLSDLKKPASFRGMDAAGERILTSQAGLEATSADLWDARGTSIRTLGSHPEDVKIAVISANGLRILTGSSYSHGIGIGDASPQLWDGRSGVLIDRLQHPETVRAAAISDDGRYAVTASSDLRVWNLFPSDDALLEIARSRLPPTSLNESDCERYELTCAAPPARPSQ